MDGSGNGSFLHSTSGRAYLLFLGGSALLALAVGFQLLGNLPAATFAGAGIFLALGATGLSVALRHFHAVAAHAALAENEQRFRDFAESSSDWFWEQDENLRFVRFSGGGRFSRITSEADLGKTRREVVKLGVSPEQWQIHDADLAARRPFQNFRFQRPLAGGSVIHVSVSGRPFFDARGRFRGYRGAGRDITAEVGLELELARRVEERTAELRKAQIELLRNERLSALGQLTATVAHELRNPLSAIRNTVFVIKEAVERSGLSLERPIARIERSIGRCDRIISDLLDYTRRRDLNTAPVAADSWLEEVLAEQKLPEGVAVIRKLASAGCRVSLDDERMRRVIINLVENAAQALAEMTDPAREKVIIVGTRSLAGRLEMIIEDTGPGMSAEILEKAFEPLFSTKSFGTGLGLPLVKQIVEQHGGTIDIVSEPEKGTKVVVALPVAAVKEIAA